MRGLTLVVGLLASQWVALSGFADVLHMQNGKVLRGKLERVTGDILEFHSDGLFGSTQDVPRIHLSNRHDMVETYGHHTVYGEIVYMDKFQVDIQTAGGVMRINRWKIKDIVLGTPMQQPALPDAAANATQTISLPGGMEENSHNAANTVPAVSQQSVVTIPGVSDDNGDSAPVLRGPTAEDGEDADAIPAVDRAP
jgi:hypothetical protein